MSARDPALVTSAARAAAQASFMEYWPRRVVAAALPHRHVPLHDAERAAIVDLAHARPVTLGTLQNRIREAAEQVDTGSGVFLRLGPCGWGAQCRQPRDAARLLEAQNERVAHVLAAYCEPDSYPFDLYIRPWIPLQPACELRMFVDQGVVVAASQRHVGESLDAGIDATALFDAAVQALAVFADALPAASMVVDLVPTPAGVKLVDVAPFSADSGAALFAGIDALAPELRFVDGGAVLRCPFRPVRVC